MCGALSQGADAYNTSLLYADQQQVVGGGMGEVAMAGIVASQIETLRK